MDFPLLFVLNPALDPALNPALVVRSHVEYLEKYGFFLRSEILATKIAIVPITGIPKICDVTNGIPMPIESWFLITYPDDTEKHQLTLKLAGKTNEEHDREYVVWLETFEQVQNGKMSWDEWIEYTKNFAKKIL